MVYTKMADIYDNTIVCEKCNKKTEKTAVPKDGIILRGWTCPGCKQTWIHPADLKDYSLLSIKKFEDVDLYVFNG